MELRGNLSVSEPHPLTAETRAHVSQSHRFHRGDRDPRGLEKGRIWTALEDTDRNYHVGHFTNVTLSPQKAHGLKPDVRVFVLGGKKKAPLPVNFSAAATSVTVGGSNSKSSTTVPAGSKSSTAGFIQAGTTTPASKRTNSQGASELVSCPSSKKTTKVSSTRVEGFASDVVVSSSPRPSPPRPGRSLPGSKDTRGSKDSRDFMQVDEGLLQECTPVTDIEATRGWLKPSDEGDPTSKGAPGCVAPAAEAGGGEQDDTDRGTIIRFLPRKSSSWSHLHASPRPPIRFSDPMHLLRISSCASLFL